MAHEFHQTIDGSTANVDHGGIDSDEAIQFDENLTHETQPRVMPSKSAGMPAKTVLAIAISATIAVVVAGGLAYRTWTQFTAPHGHVVMHAPRLSMAAQARMPMPVQPRLAPAQPVTAQTLMPAPAPMPAAQPAVAAAVPPSPMGAPNLDSAMTAPAAAPVATNGMPAPVAPVPTATPLPPPPTVTFEQGTIPPALVTALADISARIDKMNKTLKALQDRIPDSAESKAILQKLHSLEHENALLAATDRRLYNENYRLLHKLELLRAQAAALHKKLNALKTAGPRINPLDGWTVAGVGPTAAVLTGPNGAMKLVRRDSVLNGVRILSMRPSEGEVVTSDGVLRAATQ